MSALLKAKKNIFKIISILVLISRKIFSKNQTFSKLSKRKNPVKTIPYVFKDNPSIFEAPILVVLVVRPRGITNTNVMTLISLLKLIRGLEWSPVNCMAYQIHGVYCRGLLLRVSILVVS